MEVPEKGNEFEDSPRPEFKAVDDPEIENANHENSEPVEEIPDQNIPKELLESEKLEENIVDFDPVSENVPSLSEEFTQTTNDPVEKSLDSVSNGIKTNGVSSVVIDEPVSKETEETIFQDLGGNDPEESSGAVDLAPNQIVANAPQEDDNDAGEVPSSMTEIPRSTENEAYMAVTPRPLQRASWRNCCGLFELLRRSDQ